MNIKPWIIIVFAAILCASLYGFLTERVKRKTAEQSLDLAVSGKLVTNAKAPLASTHIDSNGVKHSTFNTTSLINKAPVAVSKGLLDTITKDLNNVKPGEVTSYDLISARAEANGLKAKVDSLQKKLAFAYSDSFLKLRYNPSNGIDPNDHGTFDFLYNIRLKSVGYTKGLKILGVPFGSQQAYVDVSSKDTRATIEGLEHLTIAPKQPPFILNLQAAGNYSFIDRQFQFGPALQLDAKHFSLEGVAYYNNDPLPFKGSLTSKFNPQVNFRYKPF